MTSSWDVKILWGYNVGNPRQGLPQHEALNTHLDTLRPRQNGHHFPDDIFKCIFLNENVWISIRISLKFAPEVPINNKPALIQIMAWRLTGAKPLSEPMMAYFTDAYMRHSASMNLLSCWGQTFMLLLMSDFSRGIMFCSYTWWWRGSREKRANIWRRAIDR